MGYGKFHAMQMLDIDAWSRRVRGIVGLDEMHNAVRAFERNVHWAVQNEGRIRQPSRSKVSQDWVRVCLCLCKLAGTLQGRLFRAADTALQTQSYLGASSLRGKRLKVKRA